MGGPNLEVAKVRYARLTNTHEGSLTRAKFGMYIMFPIGIMYYFGTNLDARFSTPDFWPKPGETHVIPYEKEEIKEELERLKARRLAARERRLELERMGENTDIMTNRDEQAVKPKPAILEAVNVEEPDKAQMGSGKGWLSWLR